MDDTKTSTADGWDRILEPARADVAAARIGAAQRLADAADNLAGFVAGVVVDDPGEPLRSRLVDAARRATDAARLVRELYVEPPSAGTVAATTPPAAADAPRDIEAELAAWDEFERAARARANDALEHGEDLITTLRGLDAELRMVPARKRATDMAGAIGHALAGSLQDAGVVFANPENAPIQLAAAMLAGWTQLDRTPTADSVGSFNVAALLPDAIAHAVEHGDGADPESCAIIQRATAAAGDTK